MKKEKKVLALSELASLTLPERKVLWAWLEVHPFTPLADVHQRLVDDGINFETVQFALSLLEIPESDLQDPLPLPPPHPLRDMYTADELKTLARKLDIVTAYRPLDDVAIDISALAKEKKWNADTLNLFLHTRKMPKITKKEDILG